MWPQLGFFFSVEKGASMYCSTSTTTDINLVPNYGFLLSALESSIDVCGESAWLSVAVGVLIDLLCGLLISCLPPRRISTHLSNEEREHIEYN